MSVGDSVGFFAYSELTVAVSWQSLTTRSDSMAKACLVIVVVLVFLVFLAALECYQLGRDQYLRLWQDKRLIYCWYIAQLIEDNSYTHPHSHITYPAKTCFTPQSALATSRASMRYDPPLQHVENCLHFYIILGLIRFARMIGYDLSPSVPSRDLILKFFARLQLYNSSITALKQLYWQRWNSDTGSAGTARLATLEQLDWRRCNSLIGSAGIVILAALEQLDWQYWNGSTGSTGTARLVALE